MTGRGTGAETREEGLSDDDLANAGRHFAHQAYRGSVASQYGRGLLAEVHRQRRALASAHAKIRELTGEILNRDGITAEAFADLDARAAAAGITPDDDLDTEHLRLPDGRCVISVGGQGHLPCTEHTAPAAPDLMGPLLQSVRDAKARRTTPNHPEGQA